LVTVPPLQAIRRALPLLIAVSTVASGPNAQGALLQGGYDAATRQLEEGFKIVATQRIASDNECYPAPDEVAFILRRKMDISVVLSPSPQSAQGSGLVNVISGATGCNRLVLAIRSGLKGRVFVLDSAYGPVYVQGGAGLSQESLARGAGPLRDLTAATKAIQMNRPDESARFAVYCPAGTSPLGGAMVNTTPLGGDGEGIYPHSYERLGVQSGFHVTSTLVDPRRVRAIHRGELQVICGLGLVPTASPHATTFVRRHGAGSVTARCPAGTELFSGGFQRTNFTTPGVAYHGVYYGGNYITESRAAGNAWRVSAAATDRDGGELTAIAYCAQDSSLPLTTVSASTRVPEKKSATVATPPCPRGRALIAGGFSFGDSHNALFADGYFTRRGTWAATGYGWFGSAELTAYGYCAMASDTVDRSGFPRNPPPAPPVASGSGSGRDWVYVALGALGLIVLALFLRRRQVVRRRRRRTRR